MPELVEKQGSNGAGRGMLRSLFPHLEDHLTGAGDTLRRGFHGIDRHLEHIAGLLQGQEGPERERLQRTFMTAPADGVATFLQASIDVPAGWHWHVTHVAIGQAPLGAATPAPGFLFRDQVSPDAVLVAPPGNQPVVGDPNGVAIWLSNTTVDFTVEQRTRLILYVGNQPPGVMAPAGVQVACTLYGEKIRNQEE